jgi:hypothetical protein
MTTQPRRTHPAPVRLFFPVQPSPHPTTRPHLRLLPPCPTALAHPVQPIPSLADLPIPPHNFRPGPTPPD